mgnify:CR=1 FL=1
MAPNRAAPQRNLHRQQARSSRRQARRPPVGLPRRRRGALRLYHHMRCHRTYGIHHTVNPKGPAGRRYKPRGRKRPARARNAAIEATRIESRGIDRKPAASRAIASACDDEALRARGIRRPAQQNA